jgi:3-carboxy-cis,cis-muconate cycloisomerase
VPERAGPWRWRYAAQAAFVEDRTFADLLPADPRVAAHLDAKAIEALLDPTAYTGLCAEMARDAATRARATAAEIGREKT